MNDEFIKEYMLSSYILVLSTKRLRRDLNPCYSCVTGKCHNQLGDGAKTRWICLQFNIPNITHYLYCCIHLNGGGRTRTYGVSLWRVYSPLPSPLGTHNQIWLRVEELNLILHGYEPCVSTSQTSLALNSIFIPMCFREPPRKHIRQ